MRKTGPIAALVACLLLGPVVGGAVALAHDGPHPPKNLKLVGDHWTAWDPPPAGPGDYIIVKDDTLWDLAAKWLGDPFLWPQIWDENRYIVDSHWIYPGDPLKIPGRPTVVPDRGPLPIREDVDEERDREAEARRRAEELARARPEPAPLVPVADSKDIDCSGFIEPEYAPSDLVIAGRSTEKFHQAEGDVVYLSQGRNQGIGAGDEFTILRQHRAVSHPVTGESLGTFIRRMGRARVLVAQENTATAVITLSCEDIHVSDELVPLHEIPVPRRRSMPAFDRWDVTPSGGPSGTIVAVIDDRMTVGTGHVVYTDLGLASGVRPGDVLTVYDEAGDLPRTMIGQAVVLTVEPLTSTVKLTRAVRETAVGGSVEVLR